MRDGTRLAVVHADTAEDIETGVAEMRAFSALAADTTTPWAVLIAGPRGRVRGVKRVRAELERCSLTLKEVKIALGQFHAVERSAMANADGHAATILANAGRICDGDVGKLIVAAGEIARAWDHAWAERSAGRKNACVHGVSSRGKSAKDGPWTVLLWTHEVEANAQEQAARAFELEDTVRTIRAAAPALRPIGGRERGPIRITDPRRDDAPGVWAYALETDDAQTERGLRNGTLVKWAMTQALHGGGRH